MTGKPALRARMRATRSAFAPVPIPSWPEFRSRLRAGAVVASYRPVPGEADPAPLAEIAAAAGCALALPHLSDRAGAMRFLHWAAGEPLEAGPFGIEQPRGDAPEAEPDVILTPLVAFDRSCARLGQGGGHYDRAFARWPDAWRVGVAWSVQEVDRIHIDSWDVPLHAVATEKEWITP